MSPNLQPDLWENIRGRLPCLVTFRHLKDIFNQAGIEVTSSNKKQIDRAIHQIVSTNYKDCSGTWKRLKQEIMTDKQTRQDFIDKLTNSIK